MFDRKLDNSSSVVIKVLAFAEIGMTGSCHQRYIKRDIGGSLIIAQCSLC